MVNMVSVKEKGNRNNCRLLLSFAVGNTEQLGEDVVMQEARVETKGIDPASASKKKRNSTICTKKHPENHKRTTKKQTKSKRNMIEERS
jgi:hypothetical protein